jgi:hypothetical protein
MISIFPLWTVNWHVATPAYGSYLSQLIRYSRVCGSCHNFLHKGLLLKLQNQGSLVARLKSSHWMFYGRHRDLFNRYGISVSEMTSICPACSNQNPVLSSFMAYHRHFDKSNSTDATNSKAPIIRPEHFSSPSVLMSGSCCLIFIFLSKKCLKMPNG